MSEVTTVARPYAKAIFEMALERNALQEWSNTLGFLALLVNDAGMKPILKNPLLSKEEIGSIFVSIGADRLNKEAKNLIEILAAKKRLQILPAIASLYEQFVAERNKIIDVKVVSAYPIDSARIKRLQKALENNLNKQVIMQCAVDDKLLGGAIIYAGDQVIDGSLRSKLKRLSERLSS